MARSASSPRAGTGQHRPYRLIDLWALVVLGALMMGGVSACGGGDGAGTATAAPTETSIQTTVATEAAETTVTTLVESSIPDALLVGGAVDVGAFALDDASLPTGFAVAEDVVVLTGCTADARYCRFEQVLDYPPDTLLHNSFSPPYRLTMHAVVTTDHEILDAFLVDRADGESANTIHAVEAEFDPYRVVYPSVIIRTGTGVMMIVSDRMVDATACNGADDCDRYFASGRSLGDSEQAVVAAYRTLFEGLTGSATFEWEWSYSAP